MEVLRDWFKNTSLGSFNKEQEYRSKILWNPLVDKIKEIECNKQSNSYDRYLLKVKYVGKIYRRININEGGLEKGLIKETDYYQSWSSSYKNLVKLEEKVGPIYIHAKTTEDTFGIDTKKYMIFLKSYVLHMDLDLSIPATYFDRFLREYEVVFPMNKKFITEVNKCKYNGDIEYCIPENKWFSE